MSENISDVRSHSSSQVNYEEVLNTAVLALNSSKESKLLDATEISTEIADTGIHTSHNSSSCSSSSSSSSNNSSHRHGGALNKYGHRNRISKINIAGNTTTNKNNHNPKGESSTDRNETMSSTSIVSMTKEDAAMLSSLPKKPIANFPSKDDRKRIIGCLAAILSMMFDYENDGLLDYSSSLNSSKTAATTTTDSTDINNSIDASQGMQSEITRINNMSLDTNSNSNNNNNTSQENISWETEGPLSGNGESVKFNTSIESYENNTTTSTDGPSTPQTKRPENKGRIIQRSNNCNTTPNRRRDKRSIVEQQRYKCRRHEIYSSFLVFSAELLLLDKSNAVAFLPLLNSLLGDNKPTFNGVEVGTDSHSMSGSMSNSTNTHTHHGSNNDANPGNEHLLRGWSYHSNNQADSLRNAPTRINSNNNNPQFETSSISSDEEDKPKQTWDNNDLLIPFVESLSPGAGFQCLSLLLMKYLLQSKVGYDARIRYILKKLGLVIISHEMKSSGEYEGHNDDSLAKLATRKFEALENAVAIKLLRLSAAQQEAAASRKGTKDQGTKEKKSMTMKNIVRGLKVGSVGIAAGTLFAVTGGLAAPGIAAGLAASGLTATAAAASIVTTLTSTAAVTTIFGVGGGSLAAYKTHRRTKGLTEFMFNKEFRGKNSKNGNKIEGNLFSTVCISGWLTDEKDFQRPWGVEPTNPPITDWTEKLMRFYAIYKPENIPRCDEILRRWKGEERHLWIVLRRKYGRDPDHLYPLQNDLQRSPISFLESEILDNLLEELGYALFADEKVVSNDGVMKKDTNNYTAQNKSVSESLSINRSSQRPQFFDTSFDDRATYDGEQDSTKQAGTSAHHVWEFQGEYGGELLTVRWESDLLIELCDSVTDMAVDLVGTAAKEILKQTALSAFITAIAWPYGLVRAANMIDGTWTLAIERADLAGIELARSLLESQAGHRPVVLAGFSMGARTVYSCLKELARHQQKWEEQRIAKKTGKDIRKKGERKKKDANEIEYTREPASIVEDAIMMGLPNHLSLISWESCRSVVAGRLINCYSGNDWILSLMFQFKRLAGALKSVCGTSPVNVPGVENYDVSNFISAHSDYCKMIGHILRMINHGCPYRSSAVITVPNKFGQNDE